VRTEFLGAASLVSALLALSCCGSALLFLLFGVTVASAGFLDVLAPYQPWFQGISLLLLLLAWVRLYRRRTCVRNSRRTLGFLVAVSLLLMLLLALPYMEFA